MRGRHIEASSGEPVPFGITPILGTLGLKIFEKSGQGDDNTKRLVELHAGVTFTILQFTPESLVEVSVNGRYITEGIPNFADAQTMVDYIKQELDSGKSPREAFVSGRDRFYKEKQQSEV